jgi:hypothetical protein
MDSTTKSMAVPADEMLDEAPGAETLSHNQSTEKKNLKAFGLAEETEEEPPIGKGKKAYVVTAADGKKVTVLADYEWQAKDTAQKHWKLATDAGIRVTPKVAPAATGTTDTPPPNNTGAAYTQATQKATGNDTEKQAEPTTTWQRVKQAVQQNWNVPGGPDSTAGLAKALGGVFGVAEGDVVPFKKKHDDEDDDSWIPSVDDFEQEEKNRNRKRGPANDIDEELTPVPSGHKGLNRQQKAAGQVGPTEKAKNISPVLGKPQKEHPFNGKLVGAESTEIDPELARIMEIAGIKSK